MYKKQILELRNQGYSYTQIVNKIGCSKSVICYHLNEKEKIQSKIRNKKNKNKHPFISKYYRFINKKIISKKTKINQNIRKTSKILTDKISDFFKDINMNKEKHTFGIEDIINKFTENPICYLTGKPIDIHKPRTYHFDHIIPISKGGSNDLDNLGICTKKANMSKSDMTHDEYIEHCKTVLKHHGYNISK